MNEIAKLTKNQSVVRDALMDAGRAMTAYDILDAVRAEGIRAPVQVYRALERLLETGLVHRIESMNAFVACAHDHGHDGGAHGDVVAFSICKDCGDVSELSASAIAPSVEALAKPAKFATESAIVELRGHCSACTVGRTKE